MPPDYHMHTPLCRHATGEPTEYAAQAKQVGLSEIGFSDHSPMARDDFDDWRMKADELEEYIRQVKQAQTDHPSLTIRLALEIDFLPGQEDWIRELVRRHPWDYVIGSVHYVSSTWALDNPNQIDEWERRDPDEVWGTYFDWLTQAVNTKLFDIIGHADLCKKFRYYPNRDLTPDIGRFLDAAQATDTAIEINTAGLRKDCGEMYPSLLILKKAFRREIGLTFGSDAHNASEVGMAFPEAVKMAKSAGYRSYCRFEGRSRKTEPLP